MAKYMQHYHLHHFYCVYAKCIAPANYIFCPPLISYLATKGLQGWPKLYFQVFHEDFFNRHELCKW